MRANVCGVSEATSQPSGEQSQVTEEQAREYARQVRSAPVDQVLAEVLSGLLNAAQMKLGRRDARLLIDTSSVVLEHVRPYATQQLTKQVDDALNQLRMGQVQAEKSVAAQQEDEQNDLAEMPTAPSGAAQSGTATAAKPAAAPNQSAQQPRSPKSKLWIPGRDF